MTVRKDLNLLEGKGLLRREHGFATMTTSDDIGNHLSFDYDIKHRIAMEAVKLVQDGETIIIESGASCTLLAEAVASMRRDVTIITNSSFIAGFIRKEPNAHIIMLGGEYQNESQVMVGPMVKKCVQDFYVNKFFVGTDGFNDRGFMTNNLMRAEAVRCMAESAKDTYILTESAKFSQLGVVPLLPPEKVTGVFTDEHIPQNALDQLKEKNIKVFTVSEKD